MIVIIQHAPNTTEHTLERTFASRNGGYSVRYPGTWHLLRSSLDGSSNREDLDILSCPNSKRAEAVVIIHGGAEVILRKRTTASQPKDDEVVSQRTLEISGPCSSVAELETRWEVGPKTYERDVTQSCKAPSAEYEVDIRMWEDDPKREQYKVVGRKILESLREK